MASRRSARPRADNNKPIGEAELAAVAPSLYSRPGLWPDLVLPADARDHAHGAPWTAYWALRMGALADPAADRALLDHVFAAFEARGDRLGALLATAAAIETYYYDETELEPLDAWIDRLDRAVRRSVPPWPNAECGAEVMACGSGILLRQPNHPRLAEWAAQAPRTLPHLAHGPSRIKYAAFVVQYHLWRGDFAASAVVVDALPGVDLAHLRPPEALLWLQSVAAHARFTAGFERGRAAVAEALALIDRHGLAAQAYAAHAHGAALTLAAHDAEAATRHLDAMRSTLDSRSQADQTHYWHMSAGLALLRGEPQTAVALARSTLEQSLDIGGPYRSAAHHLSLACALLAAGEHAGALAEARATMEGAHSIDAALSLFSAGLIASHALDALGQRAEADRWLAESLALGAARDYALTGGWWMPEMLAGRIARALQAGIEPRYARRLARRAGLRCPDPALEAWPWPVVLHGFGNFAVWRDGEALTASGARTPQRPLDLLRALLAHGGVSLPVATALEWLWPEADYEQQRKAFDAALLRLRRLLGDDSLLLLDGGLLLLDRTRCWSDVAALADEDATVPAGDDTAALLARAERLLHMVPGPLLDGLDAPWALAERERARRRFVLALAPIAERLETQAPREACRLYERALQADPLAESLSRRLIAAQLAQGQRAEALRAWHHCKAMLSLHGAALSDESVALARQAGFPV
jgi:LuxR family maltose regulon positive regulatory protein